MIRHALVGVALSCVAAALGLVAVSLGPTRAVVDVPSAGSQGGVVTHTRSARASDGVTRLLREHGCWTGEAPAGAPVPGHAVVTLPGARPRLVAADVGFGVWLDGDPGVLHGFCP